MTTEIEFFNDIFEQFVCSEDSIHENEIWKSNSIIKLIKASDETKNKDILEEGLRIILNLCKNRESGYLYDSYQSESCSVNDLMEQDKMFLNSILKAEFI